VRVVVTAKLLQLAAIAIRAVAKQQYTALRNHVCNRQRNKFWRANLFAIMASFAVSFASKKEDESGLSSYYNNKTTIIQEARVFNESPISPRKCRALLTRIVYLLYVGETFGTQEATTLFFGTTKLFQHKDVRFFASWHRALSTTN
jgi:hypothetical protein